LSIYTAQARQQAETKAREEGITDRSISDRSTSCRQHEYDQKAPKYTQAKIDGIVVTPLIFSRLEETMHKIMYKEAVKKTFS
jgi:hypothetical protein